MAQRRQVAQVTSAYESYDKDLHKRMVEYSISMSIRTVCFVAAYFAHGWLRWVCVALAVVLPYIAVMIANIGKQRPEPDTSALLDEAPLNELSPPPDAPDAQPSGASGQAQQQPASASAANTASGSTTDLVPYPVIPGEILRVEPNDGGNDQRGGRTESTRSDERRAG